MAVKQSPNRSQKKVTKTKPAVDQQQIEVEQRKKEASIKYNVGYHNKN